MHHIDKNKIKLGKQFHDKMNIVLGRIKVPSFYAYLSGVQGDTDSGTSGRHVLEAGGGRQAQGLLELLDQLPAVQGVAQINKPWRPVDNLQRQVG